MKECDIFTKEMVWVLQGAQLPNKNICLAEWSYQVIHFFTKKSDFEVER